MGTTAAGTGGGLDMNTLGPAEMGTPGGIGPSMVAKPGGGEGELL